MCPIFMSLPVSDYVISYLPCILIGEMFFKICIIFLLIKIMLLEDCSIVKRQQLRTVNCEE